MATEDLGQIKKDIITPNLKEAIPSTNNRYYNQNIWVIDSTTLQPVGMKHAITFTE